MNEYLHTQFVNFLNGILQKHAENLAEKPNLILVAIDGLEGDLTIQEASLIADVVKFLYPESGHDDRLRLIDICGRVKSAQCYQVLKELNEEHPELIGWIHDTMHSILPLKR
jgi:hypothetical protein